MRGAAPRGVLAGLLVLVGLVGHVVCYRPMDVVQMTMQTQMRGKRTRPVEVPHKNCPLFMHPSDSKLEHSWEFYEHLEMDEEDEEEGSIPEMKVRFALDHDRFVTPWILVHNSQTKLQTLMFTLEVQGDDIVQMNLHKIYKESLDEDDSKSTMGAGMAGGDASASMEQAAVGTEGSDLHDVMNKEAMPGTADMGYSDKSDEKPIITFRFQRHNTSSNEVALWILFASALFLNAALLVSSLVNTDHRTVIKTHMPSGGKVQ